MTATFDDWSLYVPQISCMQCKKNILLGVLDYARDYQGPAVCSNCGPVTWVRLEDSYVKELRWISDPSLLEGLVETSIPASLLATFKGALDNEHTNPGLAAVGCRFVIQEALLRKGIPDQPPAKMVNIAHSKQPPLLSEATFRSCSAAVFLGGRGGHPQQLWVDIIGRHEAREALILTRRVLLELFPSPIATQHV